MRRVEYLISFFLVMGLMLVCAKPAVAQDPVVVNSKMVRLKLENDRVRVFEATLQPGDKEQPHSHPAYVTYVLTGGKVRIHLAEGATRETVLAPGDVLYSEPVTHWAENIGTTELRFVLVEVKTEKR
jgi:quercetin dioxygenase-like cupin family protein